MEKDFKMGKMKIFPFSIVAKTSGRMIYLKITKVVYVGNTFFSIGNIGCFDLKLLLNRCKGFFVFYLGFRRILL